MLHCGITCQAFFAFPDVFFMSDASGRRLQFDRRGNVLSFGKKFKIANDKQITMAKIQNDNMDKTIYV